MSEINDTHRSEDHVQRHSDVKVQGVVIDHADGKEHGHHDHIVTAKRKRIKLIKFSGGKTVLNLNNVMHVYEQCLVEY